MQDNQKPQSPMSKKAYLSQSNTKKPLLIFLFYLSRIVLKNMNRKQGPLRRITDDKSLKMRRIRVSASLLCLQGVEVNYSGELV